MNRRHEIRETLNLALPIAFAQIALMAMGLVDAAIVGRVSEADLAAVSIGNALVFALTCPGMGVTMAVEPLASQAVGAGDLDRAWASLRAGLVACAWLTVPTLILTAASPLVLDPLGVDAAIIPATRRYVLARTPSVPFWLIFMTAKAYLEARGLTRPLYIGGWAANVVNFVAVGTLVLGDEALARVGLPAIGLPALGTLGAGLGTTISSAVLAGFALLAAWKARPAGARLFGGGDETRGVTRKLLRVGVPIGLQVLTEAGVFSISTLLAGKLGARTAAAHQIAIGLASFNFMGVLGVSSATAVRVGRAIGAREEGGPRRAGLVGIGIAAVYMGACAVVFLVFARLLARLFTAEPALIASSVTLIHIAAAFQIADGIQGVAGGALRGMGDTRFASAANVIGHWVVGLPLVLLFGFTLGHGAQGIWWGLCTGLFVVSAMLTLRFWRRSGDIIEAL